MEIEYQTDPALHIVTYLIHYDEPLSLSPSPHVGLMVVMSLCHKPGTTSLHILKSEFYHKHKLPQQTAAGWSSSTPRPATCCGTGCGPPCPRRRRDRGQRKLSKLGTDKCRPTFATRTRAAATGTICAKERTSSILSTIVKSTRQR